MDWESGMTGWGKFFELPADLTMWGLVNSQFLTTLMSATVAVVLAWYGKRAADSAADAAAAQSAVSAAQQAAQIEAEAVPAGNDAVEPPAQPGERDWRQESKAIVEEAKSFLEASAENDPDGRHQRTYDAISRHDYLVLAVALNVRGQLNPKQIAAATTIFTTWKSYEKGKVARRSVPEVVYNVLKASLNTLKNGK